ncbi:hypothetical protein AVEN_47328-1 [Araneus ventricosus]|uniref:Uncharacterized protein n=1 Tax=Araneus ventricosus TaxID=182803 RepID=A0A4Y2I3I7_ARAVE|nr:hypothetical protein AVEN_47328-1 [Araneus ventricosus]
MGLTHAKSIEAQTSSRKCDIVVSRVDTVLDTDFIILALVETQRSRMSPGGAASYFRIYIIYCQSLSNACLVLCVFLVGLVMSTMLFTQINLYVTFAMKYL